MVRLEYRYPGTQTAEEKIREQETDFGRFWIWRRSTSDVSAPDGSRLYSNHTALEYFGVTLEQWRDPNAQHGARPSR